MSDHPSTPRITDDEANQLMALILHKLGVPVPGPGAGLQLTNVLEAAKKAHAKVANKRAAPAIESYIDALEFVVGVWVHQQKLVIEQLARAIELSEEAGEEAGDD